MGVVIEGDTVREKRKTKEENKGKPKKGKKKIFSNIYLTQTENVPS